MLVYDDEFKWDGWGGMFKLAAGRCRLRLFDLNRQKDTSLVHIKPWVVVVSDILSADSTPPKISVRACAGHVATLVAGQFAIDPHKMLFVVYVPGSVYGVSGGQTVAPVFDVADFVWLDNKARSPRWRPLEKSLQGVILADL